MATSVMNVERFDDLTVRVAWRYHRHGLTQEQIAREFRVSRTTIARILQRALHEGLVELRFAPEAERMMSLEERLRAQYALQDVILVPSFPEDTSLLSALAQAAAAYLGRSLEDGMVVGLGASRTLHEMATVFSPAHKMPGCVFVEMIGGIAVDDSRLDTYNVSLKLAETCGGTAKHLFTPAVVNTPYVKAVLLNDKRVADTLDLAARSDLSVLAIGDPGPDCPLLQMANWDARTTADLQAQQAVGEIIGRFYDIEGKSINSELDDRLIGLDLERIRALRFVVAVAGGADQVNAILGALRQGFVKVLVTDFNTGYALADRPAV